MRNKGFTLIELMVVTGILVVIGSIALSLYSGLALNRTLQSGTDNVVTVLNQAKSYSQSQVKSDNCGGKLVSYSVVVVTNSKCFSLNEICSSDAANKAAIRTECLSTNVSFGNNATITFPIQNQPVTCSLNPCTILVNGQLNASKSITVDSEGVITTQ